jgi:hypothetical protein
MVRKLVDFHEDRHNQEEEPLYVVQAVCIGSVVIRALPNAEHEALVLEMMGEFYRWQEEGVYVPPTFIALAFGCLGLLPELNRRLSIRRATDLLTRTGAPNRGKSNPFASVRAG